MTQTEKTKWKPMSTCNTSTPVSSKAAYLDFDGTISPAKKLLHSYMYIHMHYLLNSIEYSLFYQLILAFCNHEQMNQLAPGVQKNSIM